MSMKRSRSGYILLVTLMVISVSMIMATATFYRMLMYTPFVTLAIHRERAKIVAYSGLQFAMNQLYEAGKKPEKPKEEPKLAAGQQAPKLPLNEHALFFKNLFASLNRWQQVELTEKTEGMAGTINYFLSCEEGKINLNTLYDFEKKKFIDPPGKTGETEKAVKELCGAIEQKTGIKDLFNALFAFLQTQTKPLVDVTQLCAVAPLAGYFKERMFYKIPQKEKKETTENRPQLFLTDLFTVQGKGAIDPWFLSKSVQAIFNFPSANVIRNNKDLETLLEQVVPKIQARVQWERDWKDTLAPIYQLEWVQVAQYIKPLLKSGFGSQFFSVVSYGTASNVTQGLYAIIELKPQSNNEDDRYRFGVRIKKLYWL